jgi:diguanylate cyclase (GGDEF)-like protein/PAS domain S-box-containing protein
LAPAFDLEQLAALVLLAALTFLYRRQLLTQASLRASQDELTTALAEAHRFREALDHVSACIFMKDLQHRYVYANKPMLDLFKVSAEEFFGSDDSSVFPPDVADRFREVNERVFAGEVTVDEIVLPDGEGGECVYWEVKAPIYEDEEKTRIWGLCGVATDITLIKRQQQQLERIAHYDSLTGLPNRVLLADRMSQAMAQAQRRNTSLAIAYLDLDGFKTVNDQHGHATGDDLLVVISKRIKSALREADTLARIGGDEFVALLVDMDTADDWKVVIGRLLQAAAEPIAVGEAVLQLSASIGIAIYPEDGQDADLLLRHADQAMYLAKQAGKNRYALFAAAADEPV